MAHAYPRHVRFASSIQQIIAPELHGLLQGGLITVTRVSVTPDLLDATVFCSVIGSDGEDVQELLDDRAAQLRHRLAKELVAKRVPRLAFVVEQAGRPDIACTGS